MNYNYKRFFKLLMNCDDTFSLNRKEEDFLMTLIFDFDKYLTNEEIIILKKYLTDEEVSLDSITNEINNNWNDEQKQKLKNDNMLESISNLSSLSVLTILNRIVDKIKKDPFYYELLKIAKENNLPYNVNDYSLYNALKIKNIKELSSKYNEIIFNQNIDTNIGNLINQVLSNQEIISIINSKEDIDQTFGEVINYCILFKEENNNIIEYLSSTDKKSFIANKIIDKLGLHNLDHELQQNIIAKYIYFNYELNGYSFHSTNSIFADNIKKEGLNGSNSFKDEYSKDILEIDKIYKKYNITIFNWATKDANKNTWCYDGHPYNILGYCFGPEWFSEFCGNALCYDSIVSDDIRNGYKEKDYNKSKLCIQKLMDYVNMKDDDKNIIFSFFNKYWNIFEKSNPSFILIPNNLIKNYDIQHEMNSIDNNSSDFYKKYLDRLFEYHSNDMQSDLNIEPEQLYEIDLTSFFNYDKVNSVGEEEYIINCNNGSMSLSKYDLLLLKLYKGSASHEDIKKVYGEDLDIVDLVNIDISIGYENLNLFLNLINNPTAELFEKVNLTNIELMMDAIKRLIDISCEYSLKNGSLNDSVYRSENINNRASYFMNNYVSSFKSTSLIDRTAKRMFGKENTYFIKYNLNDICPYIDMEKIPVGYMEGEMEILLPPFLQINIEYDKEMVVDEEIVKGDFINVVLDYENENDMYISNNDIINAINDIKKKSYSHNDLNYEDYETINKIKLYLKKYATQKYNDFIDEYNNIYNCKKSGNVK